ncbi:MAG TPA: OmpH family outer membrane protein [Acidobacteriota bacterium]|nr:OmpH family outer membrane protein [Acidobacteriota bacterium]
MHKAIRSLIASVGLLAGAAALHAQATLKIVVVDMAKVYDTHYKTEEANAKFNDAAQRAQEQLEQINKQIQSAADEYKSLVEQTKSPMANDQAKAKAGEDAQRKMEDIQRLNNEAQNFRANTQRSLQQRAKNHRDLIMDEIMKVVNDISRAKGATLVLDKSGPSILGIPVVLYSDASYDITEDVVKEVNKDRPAASGAAPASSTPAATPPAANNNSGGFTVPNVTTPPKKG